METQKTNRELQERRQLTIKEAQKQRRKILKKEINGKRRRIKLYKENIGKIGRKTTREILENIVEKPQ